MYGFFSKVLTVSAVVFMAAAPSMATSFSATHRYYVDLHFSKNAFGKRVTGVYAHLGVLTREAGHRGGKTVWVDVQHVRMEDRGSHFQGKAALVGQSAYEYAYAQGVAVQYWVYFADGSSMVTDAVMPPVRDRISVSDERSFSNAVSRVESQFNRGDDVPETRCVLVELSRIS